MQDPKQKEKALDAPNWVAESITARLREYEGKKYGERRPCPECGSGGEVKGWRKLLFAILIVDGGFVKVQVNVKYFHCQSCGEYYYAANSPFYPGCNYGKPVVDLCLFLLSTHNPPTVESLLANLGIQVDRDTIARYGKLFAERIRQRTFQSKGVLNLLKILTGAQNYRELQEKLGKEEKKKGRDLKLSVKCGNLLLVRGDREKQVEEEILEVHGISSKIFLLERSTRNAEENMVKNAKAADKEGLLDDKILPDGLDIRARDEDGDAYIVEKPHGKNVHGYKTLIIRSGSGFPLMGDVAEAEESTEKETVKKGKKAEQVGAIQVRSGEGRCGGRPIGSGEGDRRADGCKAWEDTWQEGD